jgi:hypothetical protein
VVEFFRLAVEYMKLPEYVGLALRVNVPFGRIGMIPRVELLDFFFPPPLLARAMITKPSMVALTMNFFSMWFSFSVKIFCIIQIKDTGFFRILLTVSPKSLRFPSPAFTIIYGLFPHLVAPTFAQTTGIK